MKIAELPVDELAALEADARARLGQIISREPIEAMVREISPGGEAHAGQFVGQAAGGLKFRGANLTLILDKSHDTIICSGSDTGKTVACSFKSLMIAGCIPGVHAALVRKTYNSLQESAVKTFDRICAGLPIRKIGGDHAGKYKFNNGSELVLIGLDKSDKLLSSEWDFIQVCQAEELAEHDWEVASSRCTGRGSVVKTPQIFGDCNPSSRLHWIPRRAKAGKLTLLKGRHSDNPELFDDQGQMTATGKVRMGLLERTLTGIRRKRLWEGLWVTAEGAVYDTFSPDVHVTTRPRSEMKRWFLAIDEGFTHPAVILDVGEDSDGRHHIFREFYQRNVLPENHVAQARAWWTEKYEVCAVDESAAGLIASLQQMGVNAVGAKGRVLDGIALVQNRLKVQGDGRARLTVDPGCVNTINELESYCWKPEKDMPVKENDDAADALRYLEVALAGSMGFTSADSFRTDPHPDEGFEPTPETVDFLGTL